MWLSWLAWSGFGGIPMLKDREEFPPPRWNKFQARIAPIPPFLLTWAKRSNLSSRWKVKGHVPKSKVKWCPPSGYVMNH